MSQGTRPSARHYLAGTLMVLIAAGVAGCATTRPVGDQLDDKALTAKVKAKLSTDPEVGPFEIDVDTIDGVVRLSGTVEKDATRQEAEKLARNTEGVRRVRNDIKLGDPTLGENVSDAWIATKVKAKLTADTDINPFNIDVDVVRGEVTLSGIVKKDESRTKAEQYARNTKGVKSVKNLIKVQ